MDEYLVVEAGLLGGGLLDQVGELVARSVVFGGLRVDYVDKSATVLDVSLQILLH